MSTRSDVTGSGRSDVELWNVRLSSGETRSLSLDELAAGFDAGWIDARTLVLAAGAIHWAPLGEVAGLDTDAEPSPPSSAPNSIAPMAFDAQANTPFDLEVPTGAESDPDVLAFRPRRGPAVLRVMTAMIVIAGLGFAGVRGKPAITRALASRGVPAKPAPAVVVAPPVVVATPAPATPPVAQAAPAAPVPEATPPIPTMSLTSLPSVPQTPAEKKAAAEAEKKARRAAPQKRAK